MLCQQDKRNLAKEFLVVLGALVDLFFLLGLLVDLLVGAESVVSTFLNECILRSRCQYLLLLLLQGMLCCQSVIAFLRCIILALGTLVLMYLIFHSLVLM